MHYGISDLALFVCTSFSILFDCGFVVLDYSRVVAYAVDKRSHVTEIYNVFELVPVGRDCL